MYFVKHYCSDTFGSNLAPVYIYQFKNYLHNKWQYTTSCKHNYLNRICLVKKFGLRKMKRTDNKILNILRLFNFVHASINK